MKKITHSIILSALLISGCTSTPEPQPPIDEINIAEIGTIKMPNGIEVDRLVKNINDGKNPVALDKIYEEKTGRTTTLKKQGHPVISGSYHRSKSLFFKSTYPAYKESCNLKLTYNISESGSVTRKTEVLPYSSDSYKTSEPRCDYPNKIREHLISFDQIMVEQFEHSVKTIKRKHALEERLLNNLPDDLPEYITSEVDRIINGINHNRFYTTNDYMSDRQLEYQLAKNIETNLTRLGFAKVYASVNNSTLDISSVFVHPHPVGWSFSNSDLKVSVNKRHYFVENLSDEFITIQNSSMAHDTALVNNLFGSSNITLPPNSSRKFNRFNKRSDANILMKELSIAELSVPINATFSLEYRQGNDTKNILETTTFLLFEDRS